MHGKLFFRNLTNSQYFLEFFLIMLLIKAGGTRHKKGSGVKLILYLLFVLLIMKFVKSYIIILF